jgi:hypothetical protein
LVVAKLFQGVPNLSKVFCRKKRLFIFVSAAACLGAAQLKSTHAGQKANQIPADTGQKMKSTVDSNPLELGGDCPPCLFLI